MEKQLAILMADLSGYTALTETHGPGSAADLIDTYLSLVSASLYGDSVLHESTGDEVLVVSASPDDLMETALRILKYTPAENNFLRVHGGLHFGPVLQRGNRFFGSAINVTSRIAAQAAPGTFWVSEQMVAALSHAGDYPLVPRGSFGFKNVSGMLHISELAATPADFLIDPVCRMLILDREKAFRHPEDHQMYFCSTHCRDTYVQNNAVPTVSTNLNIP